MTRLLAYCLFALLLALPAQAEQQTFGEWDIHYSVFNSTFLQPDVAATYGIVRGADRMVINVSVRKRLDDNTTREQRANVSGSHSDLIRSTPLAFREIVEKGAIYYIASFRILKQETLRFRLQVQPDANRPPYPVEFTRKLYAD